MNMLCKGSVDSCLLIYQVLAGFLFVFAIVSFVIITRMRHGSRDKKQVHDKEVYALGYIISGFFFMMSGFLWFFK